MAGHSKYANIKHRKGAQDARRGKIFTKIIRELTVAAKQGANPADNPRLRACIDKALGVNMTRETIDRAIARGAGNTETDNLEELTYEGYGPGGVAVLVQTLSDNRNRTAGEVRHAFSKRGGNLGTEGSVAYLFAKKGQISFAPGASEDLIMEVALEAGAEDVQMYDDGAIDVTTPWEATTTIKEALVAAGCVPIAAEVGMMPSIQVELDEETADKVYALIDLLEDLDDVQNVYTNADFPGDNDE